MYGLLTKKAQNFIQKIIKITYIMEKEEIIINTQFALFFENPLSRPDEFSRSFNQQMGGIFDQIPTVMPVPNEVRLLDVPVVQMNSKSGVYSCNIARGRVDFFYTGIGKQKFANIKDEFLKEVENFFSFFSDKVKIKRIGFVTRFFIEDVDQDKTIAKLLNNDFKTLHSGNTHEAFIRYVSRVNNFINEFNVNSFTSLERFSARIKDVGDNVKGIMLTRDFNTDPNILYSDKLSVEKIKEFIKESEKSFKLDDIKKILWPSV